jgi:hypothetical protein
MNAGETRSRKQLRKAALSLPSFERDSIEQKFVIRNSKQKATVAVLRQSLLQLAPGGLELAFGTLVVHSIQTRVFDEDVETMDERASGRRAAGISLDLAGNNCLLWGNGSEQG